MPSFFAGDKASIAAKFKHHNSVEHLWKTEWQAACQRGVYPFNEGTQYSDFEPIFQSLIEKQINDPFEDRWPEEFVPRICNLINEADARRSSEPDEASKLFLRASALCHIARFPVLNSTLRRIIWSMQKEAYSAATSFWKDPVKLIDLPHKHASSDDGISIPLSYRFPSRKADSGPVPVMLCISGLDGFRIDFPARCTNFFNSQGWAIIGVEIPGCGDCPAAKMDPESPDRLWSSVLDWIVEQPELDEHNVCAWGFSTGGYYSLRAAHTHANRLKGVIAQGLYAHHAFSPEWIDIMEHGEYPSSLNRSLMNKYDYTSVEEMKADSQKRFSLVDSGILNKSCCKLLMINGMDDTIYPIEDSMLVLQYGGPKEARFTQGRGHMGEPQAGSIGFAWIKRLFETPQYQLEEAFRLYQEALKLHSQQALALKDLKGPHVPKRDSRVGRKVSGILTRPHSTAGMDNGPPSADLVSDKENGSPTTREFRLARKVSPGEVIVPPVPTKPLVTVENGILKPTSRNSEPVIRGSPATQGTVVVEKSTQPTTETTNPSTPPRSNDNHDVIIRSDSDAELDDLVAELTTKEVTTKEDKLVSDTISLVPSTASTMPTAPITAKGLSLIPARQELHTKDSFEDHYDLYVPAGIETEIIEATNTSLSTNVACSTPTHSPSLTMKVNGQLTPESPRLSTMFDRSQRPVSVYRNENSKWDLGTGKVRRAETSAP